MGSGAHLTGRVPMLGTAETAMACLPAGRLTGAARATSQPRYFSTFSMMSA